MPCYQVNLISVDISATDKDLLKKALVKLNMSFTETKTKFEIYTSYGSIIIQDNKAKLASNDQSTLNKIKEAYSQEVVTEAALQFGWTVSEEEDHLVLTRYGSEGSFDYDYGY